MSPSQESPQPEPPQIEEKRFQESPPSRLNRWLLFASGFFGWYLVMALIYGQRFDQESLMICGGLLFPVNLVILVLLLKQQRYAGWGILSALGVNFVISLLLGLWNNALCFLPFFKR